MLVDLLVAVLSQAVFDNPERVITVKNGKAWLEAQLAVMAADNVQSKGMKG